MNKETHTISHHIEKKKKKKRRHRGSEEQTRLIIYTNHIYIYMYNKGMYMYIIKAPHGAVMDTQ
jgi:hypothetical protein